MTPSKLLHGTRVRLTALNSSDLQTIARWHQNGEFLRLFDARPAHPKSEAELTRWLEEGHKETNAFLFAIRPPDGDDLIGYIELDGIVWAHQVGWLAIGIGDSANRGRGYGYEAAQLVLQFAFHELNLHRLQLTVFDYNERAIALYEKLGFRREGSFREFLQRDGRRYDMHLYGLLRREWEAQTSQTHSPE